MVKRLFHLTRRTRAYRTGQRKILRHLLSLHGSPEAIALGTAIGVFVAFTPTMGIQMLLAVGLASIVGASRVASIPPVWISNPATAVPIYLFCYRVGRFVVNGPSMSEASKVIGKSVGGMARVTFSTLRLDFSAAWAELHQVFDLVGSVIVPLSVGSVLVGLLLGLATYPVVHRLMMGFRRFMDHRRAHRKRKRMSWLRRKRAEREAADGKDDSVS